MTFFTMKSGAIPEISGLVIRVSGPGFGPQSAGEILTAFALIPCSGNFECNVDFSSIGPDKDQRFVDKLIDVSSFRLATSKSWQYPLNAHSNMSL